MSGPRLEQRFNQCFGVEAFGRAQAQRVMEPYRLARERLLTTSPSTARRPAVLDSDRPVHDLPCWLFFRDRLDAAPRSETLRDLLRLGGLRLPRGDSKGASGAYQVSETATWVPSELEYRHDYIQWLFPLRETGVNPCAALLTDRDVLQLRGDGVAMANVLCSFYMMLRFYGMHLTLQPAPSTEPAAQDKTRKTRAGSSTGAAGEVPRLYTATFRRSPALEEQRAQYTNLCHHPHNFLRISRILQFLGEVGLEPLKVGWLRFLAREILVPLRIPRAGGSDDEEDASVNGYASPVQPPLAPCESSFATFWIETPYDAEVRAKLKAEALTLLDQTDAIIELDDAAAKAALRWAVDGRGRGPVVQTAPLRLPADIPVCALPFYREAAPIKSAAVVGGRRKVQKRAREDQPE